MGLIKINYICAYYATNKNNTLGEYAMTQRDLKMNYTI